MAWSSSVPSVVAQTRASPDHSPGFLAKAYVAPYTSQPIRAFEMAPESIGLLAGFLAQCRLHLSLFPFQEHEKLQSLPARQLPPGDKGLSISKGLLIQEAPSRILCFLRQDYTRQCHSGLPKPRLINTQVTC